MINIVLLVAVVVPQPELAKLSYDPFHNQKEVAFVKSMGSVVDIAAAVDGLIQEQQQGQGEEGRGVQ